MPKNPSSGRSRLFPRLPPAPPPRQPTPSPPPLSESDPDSDQFDPNRTPPPPGPPIFQEQDLEQKLFDAAQLPPLGRNPPHVIRPLTGRPPDPRLPTGVKRPKTSASKKKTGTGRRAPGSSDAGNDQFALISTSLLKIQSFLGTLAAAANQQNTQTTHTHPTSPPRTEPDSFSSPSTLADLITTPHRSRKRYA